jgi:hypothetical protein
MNDRLANRVYPTIQYVLELLDRINGRRGGGMPNPEEERARLMQYVGQLDAGRPSADEELAKKALVYWIDEVFVNASWPHSEYWKTHTLEFQLFKTLDRAHLFYSDAKTAKSVSPPDALETYYLCVALGFLGIYRYGEISPDSTPSQPTKPQDNKSRRRKPDETWGGGATQPGIDDSWTIEPNQTPPPPRPTESFFDGSSVDGPTGQGNQQGGLDLPNTLVEWAKPVYAQIAPGRQRQFIPVSPPDSQRDARPLSGWGAAQRAMMAFAWMVILLVVVGVAAIVQGIIG